MSLQLDDETLFSLGILISITLNLIGLDKPKFRKAAVQSATLKYYPNSQYILFGPSLVKMTLDLLSRLQLTLVQHISHKIKRK